MVAAVWSFIVSKGPVWTGIYCVYIFKSGMYYIIWTPDLKMAPIQSNRIACPAHTPKMFLASGFTCRGMRPTEYAQ